jgi:hypothetical protein
MVAVTATAPEKNPTMLVDLWEPRGRRGSARRARQASSSNKTARELSQSGEAVDKTATI